MNELRVTTLEVSSKRLNSRVYNRIILPLRVVSLNKVVYRSSGESMYIIVSIVRESINIEIRDSSIRKDYRLPQ